MKAEVIDGKIVVTGDCVADGELLNFMGFGRLKATVERVVDDRTPEGGTISHDALTIEFDGAAPTPA